MTEITCKRRSCGYNDQGYCTARAIVLSKEDGTALNCAAYYYLASWQREKEQENAKGK